MACIIVGCTSTRSRCGARITPGKQARILRPGLVLQLLKKKFTALLFAFRLGARLLRLLRETLRGGGDPKLASAENLVLCWGWLVMDEVGGRGEAGSNGGRR